MTVNYFIKCPTCNTITRMRTPAGYIYKTPVRIHCGKCNTLLTGEFVSDSYPQKDGSDIMLNSYLIDVALECSKMLRSTLLLIFVTYELIRYNHRSDNSTMPMHSIIYKNVRSQSLCPCGSRRKYIHCCKSIIHVDKKSNTNFDYPMEADFCMSDNFKRMKP